MILTVQSERARERVGQSPIGRFASGSELAPERKGSVPLDTLEITCSGFLVCALCALRTEAAVLHVTHVQAALAKPIVTGL